MFEFLNTTTRHDAGLLTSVAAADQFWRLLPRNDPFESQLMVSEALGDLAGRKNHTRDELRALMALDQRARSLGEALLINYARAGTQSQSFEKRSWQSAFELSQSFGHAYAQVMRHLRGGAPSRGSEEHLPIVALRLFQHRQVEFLLRPFVTERTVADGWTDLHAAYRYAESAGLLAQRVAPRRWHEEHSEESTLEREYISILFLELINGGQFSPYDAFWLNRRIPRWCAALSLQSNQSNGAADRADERFVVDLGSAQGLMRLSRSAAGALRYLDPAPMLTRVNDEIVMLRDRDRPALDAASFGRGRQLKLLRKVHTICMPKPAQVNRRGERKAVASTVKAIVGLSHIMRMLRNEERKKKAIVAPTFAPEVPEVEEITITVFGGFTESSPAGMRNNGGRGSTGTEDEFGVPHQVWQLKDRSESGCGLRGQIRDSNRLLPGALVAFRERDDMPWTLAVVRRLQKRIGDRIDIGVEYVGQNPVGVTMTDDNEGAASTNALTDKKPHRCAALYLPESARHPMMPFKTLILSSREFTAGRCLRLGSDDASYTVRLKEPIEEQDDFIWLPYEVVDRRATDQPAQDQPKHGMPTAGQWPNLPPQGVATAASAKSIAREPAKRLAGAAKV
jgi:hypothetical protein